MGELINNNKYLTATIHQDDGEQSKYMKIAIDDTWEQLALLSISTRNCAVVRVYDGTQDFLILEIKGSDFYGNDQIDSDRIHSMLSETFERLEPDSLPKVQIRNFFMDESYNNLEQAALINEKYELHIDMDMWQDI